MFPYRYLDGRPRQLAPLLRLAASCEPCYLPLLSLSFRVCGLIRKHSNRSPYRMQGDGLRGNVVPSSYVEGSIDQLAGSPPPYQGFLPAMEPAESSSRSVDNLHSPPEPAGSSYSSPVFVSVSTRHDCSAAGPR